MIILNKNSSSNATNHLGVFVNFNDLVAQFPSSFVGDLAYVENSQGTSWAPGPIFGTFYSKGTYMWNGTVWDSSVDEIANQLEINITDIEALEVAVNNHLLDSANPHSTTVANLGDTVITNPLHGEVLTYDIGSGKWINKASSLADIYAVSVSINC